MINPLRLVEVNTFVFAHPRVTPDLEGFRIAQISDVHLGRWVKPHHVAPVVDLVNRYSPDLVALTGDYVCYDRADITPAADCLGRLRAPTYAVLGNHDHWASTQACHEAFAQTPIRLLSNRAEFFGEAHGGLHVVGVDDHVTRNAHAERAFAGVCGQRLCLTLNHVPGLSPELARRGAHLILSGHTHGFQLHIPGVTPHITRRMGIAYVAGAYRVDESTLYVNRGLGSSSWPLRLGAPPELTFFELAHGPAPALGLRSRQRLLWRDLQELGPAPRALAQPLARRQLRWAKAS